MNRITRVDALTPEQEAMLPAWRDKWINIGLSTESADRSKAEEAIRACYRFAKLNGDDLQIVWCPTEKMR